MWGKLLALLRWRDPKVLNLPLVASWSPLRIVQCWKLNIGGRCLFVLSEGAKVSLAFEGRAHAVFSAVLSIGQSCVLWGCLHWILYTVWRTIWHNQWILWSRAHSHKLFVVTWVPWTDASVSATLATIFISPWFQWLWWGLANVN